MNKYSTIFLAILMIIFLAGCRKRPKPAVPSDLELSVVVTGRQDQIEDTTSPVVFTLQYKKAPGAPRAVRWYRNKILVPDTQIEGDNYTFVPVPGLASNSHIYVEADFAFEEALITYRYPATGEGLKVSVLGRSAKIELSSQDSELKGAIINRIIGKDAPQVTIDAAVTGTIDPSELQWFKICEATGGEEELTDFRGKMQLVHEFTQFGLWRIEARMRGKRFVSNNVFVDCNYGRLELSLLKTPDALKLSSNFNNELEGSFRWFKKENTDKDYKELSGITGNSLTLSTGTGENSLYRLEFYPVGLNTVIASDPLLVWDGEVAVATEEELLAALAAKAPVIKLVNDILYSKVETDTEPATLVIDYPVTIIGGFNKLASLGIFTFIKITSDNVWMKDLTIARSGRYNTLFDGVFGGYCESVTFDQPGAAGSITTPGAGAYVFGGEVEFVNCAITEGYNSGLRMEARYDGTGKLVLPAKIILRGDYHYDENSLFAPIISVRSRGSDVILDAKGFDMFVLPAGEGKLIRQWSNDAYGVRWELFPPQKIEYLPGEALDFTGVTINVKFGPNESANFDLSFLYLFFDYFSEVGELHFTPLTDLQHRVASYKIIGYDPEASGDKLCYRSLEAPNPDDPPVDPLVPLTPGEYAAHIYVGEAGSEQALYLGFITIRVVSPAAAD